MTRPTAVLALALVLAGCSASGPGPDAPAPTASASAPTATPTTAGREPAPEPGPTATPTASPAPPADVHLSNRGIGDVAFDSRSDAYDELVAVLGTPTQPIGEYCRGSAQLAEWGGLTAFLHSDGRLLGWYLEPGPLPDVLRPPHDIHPGDPLARAIELGGTPEPLLEPEETGEYTTTVDGVTWVSEDDAPEAPITWVSVRAAGCY